MGRFDPKAASEREVLQAMLGRTLDHLFPEETSQTSGETILRFEQATLRGMAPVDLAVARGEVVGVFGLLGSGYDRIGPELFAGRPALVAGEVHWKDGPLPRSPEARIESGLGFVPAERKRDGIIPELDITDNVCLPSLRRFDRGPRLDRVRMRDFTSKEIARLSIKCDGPGQEIRELSGGNQQKACLARWIDADFDLIVMEEPTRGVDLGARADIYRQIRDYTGRGGGVLLISSDVEEIAGMADRSLVFEGGRIAAVFPRGTDKAELMAAAARGGQ
jgi:ribose transport system ATP-binding protein